MVVYSLERQLHYSIGVSSCDVFGRKLIILDINAHNSVLNGVSTYLFSLLLVGCIEYISDELVWVLVLNRDVFNVSICIFQEL